MKQTLTEALRDVGNLRRKLKKSAEEVKRLKKILKLPEDHFIKKEINKAHAIRFLKQNNYKLRRTNEELTKTNKFLKDMILELRGKEDNLLKQTEGTYSRSFVRNLQEKIEELYHERSQLETQCNARQIIINSYQEHFDEIKKKK